MRLRDVRWMSLGSFDRCTYAHEGFDVDTLTDPQQTANRSIYCNNPRQAKTYGSGKVPFQKKTSELRPIGWPGWKGTVRQERATETHYSRTLGHNLIGTSGSVSRNI